MRKYEIKNTKGEIMATVEASGPTAAMVKYRRVNGAGFPNGAIFDGNFSVGRAAPVGEAGVESLTIDWEPVPTRRVFLPWQKAGLSYTRTGYGPRIPTVNQVWYGGRWRRVYVCIWSNSGTCFIGRNISTGKVVR